ncbi:MAG: hypothetical protein JNK96_08590 [Betaproteobacteria bacterium]|jgi:hypothetical protein|nr:hypothetical protein [Betaproteobacteria bacterium]HMV19934.1 glycine zipper family protein [Rhodocyclaceae bacterium]HNE42968.1 glycine zipper family protein [Rhodocyclaceae bacterium]HNM23221.1 glycine zipper family protein [Rhodocyclaceae bacterium]HNP03273.1 glycine zipper family protein [Rhodocyclaceae bacterium]
MKSPFPIVIIGLAAALLAGCATLPSGPNVLVLPGTGRSFDQFRADDLDCRQYAYQQIGGKSGEEAANQSAVRSAAVGTAIGALAGVALGGRQGAAVGAGSGLVVGSMMGAEGGYRSSYALQRSYDNAFVQCMYAKGHRVPVPAGMAPSHSGQAAVPPPPSGSPPPPPSGNPPPPPPGSPPPPPPGTR